MARHYTQSELAALEASHDHDRNDLLAEILVLATKLAAAVTEAYNGEYQEHQPTLDTHYRQPFHDILDGIRLLSDQAGELITAGHSAPPNEE